MSVFPEETPWMCYAGDNPRPHRPPPGAYKARLGLISLYDVENNASRLLGACARRAGYFVAEIYFKDWINNHFDPPRRAELSNLIRLIRRNKLDVVGISIRASAYHKVAVQISEMIRRFCPNILIMWGGTHAVLDPEACLKTADFVCRGEGEITIVQLLDCLSSGVDFSHLPNIWVNTPNGIIRNEVGPTIQNLDTLPFRDYTSPDKYFLMGNRIKQGDPMIDDPCFQMMGSRGCVFACAYCYNSELSDLYKTRGKYFRVRSVDSVLAELRQARRVFRNMKRIRFDDEVFLFTDDWYREFARRYPVEVGLPYEVFTEPKLVRREIFSLLKESGLQVVYMGIQNTNRVNADLYDRRGSDEQILHCVKIFSDLDLDARYHVMLDDTESTWEDKRHLFDLLMSFPRRKFQLYLFSVVIFPNTKLARRLLAEGKITPADLEGERNKTFQQIRVSLNYPRPPEDLFWAAMLVLITKDFLPTKFLYWLAGNAFLQRHPKLLAWFAQACNIIKMVIVVFGMWRRGEMSWTLVRRWANVRSLITQ
ncbi:cobalamin-dependent protein [bacterium]|nr:cobalamin-dependent protein [bacterium]